jgi:hypothetical protein
MTVVTARQNSFVYPDAARTRAFVLSLTKATRQRKLAALKISQLTRQTVDSLLHTSEGATINNL